MAGGLDPEQVDIPSFLQEAEEYRAILAGEYSRRDADSPSSSCSEDVKSAAKSYKDSFAASADPLSKVFADVGEAVSGAAGKVWSRFGSRDSDNGDGETGSEQQGR